MSRTLVLAAVAAVAILALCTGAVQAQIPGLISQRLIAIDAELSDVSDEALLLEEAAPASSGVSWSPERLIAEGKKYRKLAKRDYLAATKASEKLRKVEAKLAGARITASELRYRVTMARAIENRRRAHLFFVEAKDKQRDVEVEKEDRAINKADAERVRKECKRARELSVAIDKAPNVSGEQSIIAEEATDRCHNAGLTRRRNLLIARRHTRQALKRDAKRIDALFRGHAKAKSAIRDLKKRYFRAEKRVDHLTDKADYLAAKAAGERDPCKSKKYCGKGRKSPKKWSKAPKGRKGRKGPKAAKAAKAPKPSKVALSE